MAKGVTTVETRGLKFEATAPTEKVTDLNTINGASGRLLTTISQSHSRKRKIVIRGGEGKK